MPEIDSKPTRVGADKEEAGEDWALSGTSQNLFEKTFFLIELFS